MFYSKLKERPPNFRINRGVGHPLAKGCVLAMLGRLPGTGISYDSSAYRRNGALTNMDANTDWVFLSALGRWGLDFDGVDDYVRIENGGGLFNQVPGSIAGWARWIGLQDPGYFGYGAICGRQQDYVISSTVIELSQSNPNTARIQFKDVADNVLIMGTFSPGDGVWRHIAVTWTSTGCSLFVDGALDMTGGTMFGIYKAPYAPFTIGAWIDHGSSYSRSQLADWLHFNRVLSQSEISALADPDNVDLRIGGVPLILPPRRVWWPVAHISGTKKTPWHLMIQGAV